MTLDALWHALSHSLLHALQETLVLIPFLYITYLLMELLERRAGERTQRLIARTGKAGPVVGALLGVLPQCGFSAAGAGLYAGRVITVGTLLSIFWSTSDEMLPLLLSSGAPIGRIVKILLVKVAVAAVFGLAVDAVARLWTRRRSAPCPAEHIGEVCREGHCHCESQPLPLAALVHTLRIALTVFVVSLGLHTVMELVGEQLLSDFLRASPYLACVCAALVGLIPNCASSVAITTLYLQGLLSPGALLSGLLVGAGVGLLVLFRTNRPLRDTLRVVALLFGTGVITGLAFDALSLGSLLGL